MTLAITLRTALQMSLICRWRALLLREPVWRFHSTASCTKNANKNPITVSRCDAFVPFFSSSQKEYRFFLCTERINIGVTFQESGKQKTQNESTFVRAPISNPSCRKIHYSELTRGTNKKKSVYQIDRVFWEKRTLPFYLYVMYKLFLCFGNCAFAVRHRNIPRDMCPNIASRRSSKGWKNAWLCH